jgi:trehalose synthase
VTRLDSYAPLVGTDALCELRFLASKLRGTSVLHVNSTAVGGGVAEILNRMVPLMAELGLETRWDVMKGGEAFYAVTKKFHNALHGDPLDLVAKDYRVYEETVEANLASMDLDRDIVFVHDPQPLALVKRRGLGRWLWRCHIDLSRPDARLWEFLLPYVQAYDALVVSSPAFAQRLAIPQIVIPPSIDPLSDKNRPLDHAEISRILDRLRIPTDKPLVTQVSRFDRLKDPLGVIQAFRALGPYVRARLLLVGGSADDDPEGAAVQEQVRRATAGDDDIIVLALPPTSHVEINAIQRASTIIVQKSIREGFGLTVSEALWKGKPVVAGAVGGIPQQIVHRQTGVLVYSIEGTTYWLRHLLLNPGYARGLGERGREHVRNNFLLTRHLRDYLLLFLYVTSGAQEFISL